jgi:hypothetical protein
MHDEAGRTTSFTNAIASFDSYQGSIDLRRAFRCGMRVGCTIRDYDPSNLSSLTSDP